MKELLKALKIAEEKADRIDAAWDADPENEALEAAFDEAYAAQYKAFEAVVKKIVSMTGGKIDQRTAGTMLRMKRSEIESLVSRMA